MRTPVRVYQPPRVRPAYTDDVDALLIRKIQELEAVRSVEHARAARRFALDMRIVLSGAGLAILIKCPCPGQNWYLADLQIRGQIHRGIVQTTRRVRRQGGAGIALPNAFFARNGPEI